MARLSGSVVIPATSVLLGQPGPAGPPPFSPTDLAGLAQWSRGDLLVTQAAGIVSAWGDSATEGDANHNWTAPVPLQRPTFTASNAAYNNHPTVNNVVVTGGPNSFMQSGVWTVPLAAPYTFFVAAHCVQGVGFTLTFPEIWNDKTSGNAGVYAHFPSGDTTHAFAGVFDGLGEIDNATSGWTSPSIVIVVNNGASSQLYFNSHLPTATGSLDGSTITSFFLGAADTVPNAEKWNGPIAEEGVYRRVLAGAEITQLANYLSVRYAIPIA